MDKHEFIRHLFAELRPFYLNAFNQFTDVPLLDSEQSRAFIFFAQSSSVF
jgi:hypothetical protein